MYRRFFMGVVALVIGASIGSPAARAEENHVRGERRSRGASPRPPSLVTPPTAQRSLGNPNFSAGTARSTPAINAGVRSGHFAGGHQVPFSRPVDRPAAGFGTTFGTRALNAPTVTPRAFSTPYSTATPLVRSRGTYSSEALDRLRARGTGQGLQPQIGSNAGVRRGTSPSPRVDTGLPQAGMATTYSQNLATRRARNGIQNPSPLVRTPRSGAVTYGGAATTSGGTYQRGGAIQYGDGGSQMATRQGSVSYGGSARRGGAVQVGGGGAVAATHRRGVVSYGHGSHGHGSYGHAGRRVRSHHYHGGSPWWWHRGPRYGFGFGISSYDPWPWYDTWGFGTTVVYEPVPVYPAPIYVVPSPAPSGYVLPPDGYPADPYAEEYVPQDDFVPQGPQGAPYQQPFQQGPAPSLPGQGLPAPSTTPPGANPQGEAAPMNEEVQKGLEESFDLFRTRRYAEAFSRLDIVVRANPNSGEAWMGRFYAAFALGLYSEAARSLGHAGALGAFPRGYRFDPRPLYDAEAGTQAIGGASAERLFDTFFARLSSHLNANPSDPNGYAVLAYLHVALGRTAEAQAALASLAALHPSNPVLPALRTAMLPQEQPGGPAPAQPAPQAPVNPPYPQTGPFPPPR